MGEGWNRLLTEIGRFMAVGGIATFAAFVIFNFLVHGLYLTDDPWLNGHPVTAFVIANFVGMVISYRLSRYWTFKHRPPQHADGGRTAYFVINTVTMLIPMACLWISRNVLGLDDAGLRQPGRRRDRVSCSGRSRGSTCSASTSSRSRCRSSSRTSCTGATPRTSSRP